MSSSFAFFTDQHYTDKYVRWYGPGFFERQLELTQKFFEDCKDREVTHIITGGDFFDRHNDISLKAYQALLSLYQSYSRYFYFTFIFGNHDILRENAETIPESALYIFGKDILSENQFKHDSFISHTKLHKYNWGDLQVDSKLGVTLESPDESKKVNAYVSHIPIGNRTAYGAYDIQDITFITKGKFEEGRDFFFCGDQHEGFGVIIKDGLTCVNPGSFSKMNITESRDEVRAWFSDEGLVSYGLFGEASINYRPTKVLKDKKLTKLSGNTRTIKAIAEDMGYTQTHVDEINSRSK